MKHQYLHLNLDRHEPINPLWNMGGNTCHAPLWQRPDLKRQLKTVKNNLGFNYIRCHGMLSDNMEVVSADGRTFNFDRIISAISGILELGLKPFMELSSMPGAFARDSHHICHYYFRSDPPKDWQCWYDLIKALTETLLCRFGGQEVRSWYFEIWNEPDISFWSGSMDEYFRLYDLSRKAIKDVDSSLRVGGPATARTRWIQEFIDHVSVPSADDPSPGIRCDFISAHAYPSDIEFLDSARGNVILLQASVMRELFGKVRQKVDAEFGEKFPLFVGEWNSSAGPLAWNHDECNNAAFVCKTMVELMPYCQGSLYWNISDIYEECGFNYIPFHGGYGLITVNDIPKAAYHAFRFLNSLSKHGIAANLDESNEEHGVIASRSENQLDILVWNYIQPGTSGLPLRYKLSGIPSDVTGTLEMVMPEHGSAYETWRRLGAPDYLNPETMSALQFASIPFQQCVKADDILELPPGTVLKLRLDL